RRELRGLSRLRGCADVVHHPAPALRAVFRRRKRVALGNAGSPRRAGGRGHRLSQRQARARRSVSGGGVTVAWRDPSIAAPWYPISALTRAGEPVELALEGGFEVIGRIVRH